jgi:ribosomal-protein-alanine N-acetyltransferase
VTASHTAHDITLVPLSVPAMEALVAGDLEAASRVAGVPLTAYLVEHGWLWRVRLEQVRADPNALQWVARAALDAATGEVVGHVGFHGPPDEAGTVEVAYSVDPQHRRRGYATAMLRTALDWAASVPGVRTVRASIGPDNAASLATLRPFGFHQTGEQWDDEDGLELVFERPVASPRTGSRGMRPK